MVEEEYLALEVLVGVHREGLMQEVDFRTAALVDEGFWKLALMVWNETDF